MTPAAALLALPGNYLDTNAPCSAGVISACKSAGYLGCGRYAPLPGVSAAADITAQELERWLAADMASWWVQHPRFEGWDPAAHDAELDAITACNHAKLAQYAAATHGFLDMEGMRVATNAVDAATLRLAAVNFANRWAHVVLEEGFSAGVYCGFKNPMTADDLGIVQGVNAFWSDAGHRKVSNRGCSISQSSEVTIAGVKFDRNIVRADLLGGLPRFTRHQAVEIA